MDDKIPKLLYLGLSEQKAKETLRNENVTTALTESSDQVALLLKKAEVPKSIGNLIYSACTKIKAQVRQHLQLLVKYIAKAEIDSEVKLGLALEYLLAHPGRIDNKDLEKFCGVGVVVTSANIRDAVQKIIAKYGADLKKDRYKFNVGKLLAEARNELQFADSKLIKTEVDSQILKLLGPKTEADTKAPAKKQKSPPAPPKDGSPAATGATEKNDGCKSIQELMAKVTFHKPGENHKTDGYVINERTMGHLEKHLKRTGGQVRTRFPPEPNGILHIGHAKAVNINFGYAASKNGVCILRYDDTNPEKEEERFFEGILDAITWLGYKPYKITHSSDYFDKLYELAVLLITKGLAYVCHQSSDELKGFNPPPSPWRDRPIEESLGLFEDMKRGKIDEGAATLRMKITLEEGKQDPVAYRIRFVAHHRTGDKWCIYPTYDFTHCLCDSIEDITHSLCTKEFQSRRSAYYWLCNSVDVYCPVQWEYGRLNVNYTVVSKRKIAKLIETDIVRDWDDPRLFTLTAMRRKGFPPEAINSFCAQLGLTGSLMSMDPAMLDSCVRDHLNTTARRVMAVLDPLKVVIENFDGWKNGKLEFDVPHFPAEPECGSRKIVLLETLFIENEDFREDNKDTKYRRLCLGQPVGLHHTNLTISLKKVVKDASGKIQELIVSCKLAAETEKPKAFIHWVSDPSVAEVRLYERLFLHKRPEDVNEVPGGFLSDCNPNSLTVFKESYVEKSLMSAKVYDRFQFERLGYFTVDIDSKKGNLVFNRTVTLREDKSK